MLKTVCTLLVAVQALQATASEVPAKFIAAIHQVESSGRYGAIKGDNGRALGPFQIHASYWADANIPGKYEQCADYDYSVKVINAYLKKYAPNSLRKGKYEYMARIHNGGPNGHKSADTLTYWAKVKKHL